MLARLKSLVRRPVVRDEARSISAQFVRREIVKMLEPILVAGGFSRFRGGRCWRTKAKVIDVIEVHFFKTPTTTSHSPSIACGRYFTFVPQNAMADPIKSLDGQLAPSEPQCHIRKIVYKTLNQKKTRERNIWLIEPDGENLRECLEDIKLRVEGEVLPWFDFLDDMGSLLPRILKGTVDMEGRDPDLRWRGVWNFGGFFGTHVLAGLMACELKQWTIAVECLAPVIHHGGVVGRGGQVFPLSADGMERVRSEYVNALGELN
jgi:hypothetical protein